MTHRMSEQSNESLTSATSLLYKARMLVYFFPAPEADCVGHIFGSYTNFQILFLCVCPVAVCTLSFHFANVCYNRSLYYFFFWFARGLVTAVYPPLFTHAIVRIYISP